MLEGCWKDVGRMLEDVGRMLEDVARMLEDFGGCCKDVGGFWRMLEDRVAHRLLWSTMDPLDIKLWAALARSKGLPPPEEVSWPPQNSECNREDGTDDLTEGEDNFHCMQRD